MRGLGGREARAHPGSSLRGPATAGGHPPSAGPRQGDGRTGEAPALGAWDPAPGDGHGSCDLGREGHGAVVLSTPRILVFSFPEPAKLAPPQGLCTRRLLCLTPPRPPVLHARLLTIFGVPARIRPAERGPARPSIECALARVSLLFPAVAGSRAAFLQSIIRLRSPRHLVTSARGAAGSLVSRPRGAWKRGRCFVGL